MTKVKTDLEILDILKKEIKRLGLEEHPSRTKMQEVYNKDKMPHPNTYVNRFGSWRKALEMIGIEYKGNAGTTHNKGKKHAATWSNMSSDDVVDALLSEVHAKGIRTATEYQEKRDKGSSPSVTTMIYLTGYKWSDISAMYKERYGVNMGNGSKKEWVDMTKKEIADIVINEINKIGSTRYVDYDKCRDRENTPSIGTIVNKGMSWSQIVKMREENSDD